MYYLLMQLLNYVRTLVRFFLKYRRYKIRMFINLLVCIFRICVIFKLHSVTKNFLDLPVGFFLILFPIFSDFISPLSNLAFRIKTTSS